MTTNKRRYTVTDSLATLPVPIATYATLAEALAARDRLEAEPHAVLCSWGWRYLVGHTEQ